MILDIMMMVAANRIQMASNPADKEKLWDKVNLSETLMVELFNELNAYIGIMDYHDPPQMLRYKVGNRYQCRLKFYNETFLFRAGSGNDDDVDKIMLGLLKKKHND